MNIKEYGRQKVKQYAQKWAYLRNPRYYDYELIGGDCTNFASQCIFEGSKVMNYNKLGWYYKNANDKSASWTGVEYLYNFLVNNKGVGPFAEKRNLEEAEIGDIIQLSFDGTKFAHSLVIINRDEKDIYISTHTFDANNKPLSKYIYKDIRLIHILGVRTW